MPASVRAPEGGPHAWLKRMLPLGTPTSLRPEREAVLVRVSKLA